MASVLPHERRIVTRLIHGDEDAFSILFNAYSPILTSFLATLNLESDDIKDIIQQTFLKVWENRDKIEPSSSFKNYIITIAKNDIYNKVKKNIIIQKYQDKIRSSTDHFTEDPSSELSEILANVLATLPERRRKVFEMSRIQGYSNREISDELGISKSTVENHINNSSSVIKKILRSLGFGVFIFIFFILS